MAENDRSLTVREQGTVPIQCPKLTETNYTTWSIMIETVLRAYGHWDAITEDEVDEKKNYTTKGAELVQKARLQTLRNEFQMLKMKDNESINDFSGKINSIVAKFKSLGSTLEEEVIVRKFLNSVPMKYLPIVAPIEQYLDLAKIPFEEAVGRVKAYEERFQGHEEKDEEQNKLLLASEQRYGESSGRGRGRGRSYGRGRGRGSGRGDKSGFRFYECGEYGHFKNECTNWNDKEVNLIPEEEPTLL
ncbi:uncharacterized protein [Rutidosis leptorrhynchoides]|uniref:uncharacterized protein n=1 Tax=Rutidosis leptorrhynchoides TaxID=125765 RepID=UPI003A9A397D